MQVACPSINDNQFLSSVLGHIDCQAQTIGAAGYQAMANGGSATSLLLGGVLTIFLALFGYRLILGDTPDARTGIITVIKVGAVLVLATSWPAFRTLAYDVALTGPAELAGAIGGPSGLPGSNGGLVSRLQGVDDQIAELTVIGTGKPPNADVIGPSVVPVTPQQQEAERKRLEGLASHARWDPAHDLSLLGSARTFFLAATIGSFAGVRLLAGLLLALGPLFAIFLLFDGTRGLFEGWVRGLVGSALAALGTAIVLGVELALLEPWLGAVMALRHQEVPTPAVPVELLALTLIFAITLAAVLIGIARVAQGFRMPDVWVRVRGMQAAGQGERVRLLAAPGAAESVAGEQRSRAIAISDAVAATQRRESGSALPGSVTRGGRSSIAPATSTREIAVATAIPLGQSFRRRTRGRVSAGAMRRDSNR